MYHVKLLPSVTKKEKKRTPSGGIRNKFEVTLDLQF